jgi:hypothetical protein
MKKCSLFSYVLEDDKTETGGTSCENETLLDFCQEAGRMDLLYQRNIKGINKALKECGIKPIDTKKLYNGWQISIEICDKGESKVVVCSPLFKTEAQADKWYRGLDFADSEFRNLDIFMLRYIDGSIEDTYLLG